MAHHSRSALAIPSESTLMGMSPLFWSGSNYISHSTESSSACILTLKIALRCRPRAFLGPWMQPRTSFCRLSCLLYSWNTLKMCRLQRAEYKFLSCLAPWLWWGLPATKVANTSACNGALDCTNDIAACLKPPLDPVKQVTSCTEIEVGNLLELRGKTQPRRSSAIACMPFLHISTASSACKQWPRLAHHAKQIELEAVPHQSHTPHRS